MGAILDETLGTAIRDPVHQYVTLFPSELHLLSSPLMQRLRYVKQNATCHLTYPGATGSRFEHSLGTTELAYQMLSSALDQSERRQSQAFMTACREQFSQFASEQRPELPRPPKDSEELRVFLLRVIRFVALVHDIGTPPYSHTSEEVIEGQVADIYDRPFAEQWGKYREAVGGAFHEFVGLHLVERNSHIAGAMSDLHRYVLRVLSAGRNERSVFRTLREIVATDIDADRCDYVPRDNHTSGAGFGQFDIRRLIASLRIQEVVEKGTGGQEQRYFVIRPGVRAQSCIECIYLQRYQSYRWMYFHHRVVATNTILREVIYRLCLAKNDHAQPFCEFAPTLVHPGVTAGYDLREAEGSPVEFDDVSLLTALRAAHRAVLRGLETGEFGDYTEEDFLQMGLMLDELLLRRVHGVPLWKDPNDFLDYDKDELSNEVKEAYLHHQTEAKKRVGESLHPDDAKEVEGIALNWIAKGFLTTARSVKSLEAEFKRLSDEQGLKGFILLTTTFFKPFEYNRPSEYKLIGRDGLLHHVSKVSGLVRELHEAARRDIKLHAYFVSCDRRPGADDPPSLPVEEVRRHARAIFKQALLAWLPNRLTETGG